MSYYSPSRSASRSYSRSRSRSRSVSYSRSSRSNYSTRSLRPDYSQIAKELVDGAPSETVYKRDLKHVLIQLSIMRNEALSLKDYAKVDSIGEIIKDLNARITPPPLRRSRHSPQKQMTLVKAATEPTSLDDEKEDIDKPMPVIVTQLPEDEVIKIEDEIDDMIETRQLIDIDEVDYPKYYFVMMLRREQLLDNRLYDEVRELDALHDSLKRVHNYPKEQWDTRKEELIDRIQKGKEKIKALKNERENIKNNMEKDKQIAIENLKREHKERIDRFEEDFPTIDDQLQNKPSKYLLDMRKRERIYGSAREYERAKDVNQRANQLEAQVKNENEERLKQRRNQLKNNMEQKNAAEIFCLTQKWDSLISRELNECNKKIHTSQLLLAAAQRELEGISRKDFITSFKNLTV